MLQITQVSLVYVQRLLSPAQRSSITLKRCDHGVDFVESWLGQNGRACRFAKVLQPPREGTKGWQPLPPCVSRISMMLVRVQTRHADHALG
jgi:hypothetical protein